MRITTLLNNKVKMGLAYLIMGFSLLVIVSCEKEELVKEPPKPEVGFIKSSYTVSKEINALAFLEVNATSYVEPYEYPVYFQVTGSAVKDVDYIISHDQYTAPDGQVYYKIRMARGIRKGAVAIRPLTTSVGGKSVSIKLFPDLEGSRYVLNNSNVESSLLIQ